MQWAAGATKAASPAASPFHPQAQGTLASTLPCPEDIVRVSRHPRETTPCCGGCRAALCALPAAVLSHHCWPSPAGKEQAECRAPAIASASCAVQGERGHPRAAAWADHVAPNEIQTLAER